MVHNYARVEKRKLSFHWALVVSTLCIFPSCLNKTNTENRQDEVQQCLMEKSEFLKDEPRLRPHSPCQSKANEKAPALFAHFVEQTLIDDICLEDVINNLTGTLECATGPFLIEGNSVSDQEQIWQLSSMPDYFVWHLDEPNSFDETFLITDQSGFPIRSEILKLQSNNESTLVLFPKAVLNPGTKYFIYLILNARETKHTWIQPIATTAKSPAPTSERLDS